jgi:hypothetical protein
MNLFLLLGLKISASLFLSFFQKISNGLKTFNFINQIIDFFSLEGSLLVVLISLNGLACFRGQQATITNIQTCKAYTNYHNGAFDTLRMVFDFTSYPLDKWTQVLGIYITLSNFQEKLYSLGNIKNTLHKFFIGNQTKQRAYKKLLTAYEASTSNQDLLPIEPYKDVQLKRLIFQLKKSTYNGNTISYFANPYTIYQTKKLIEKNEPIFKNAYALVGKADSYISLAQFYKDQKCHFAQYIDNKIPILELSSGIHPSGLDYKDLIRNDFLHKSINAAQPIVVSGKNGSGKSFNTKMFILSALLTQTLTFTFTDNPCVITPFDYFKIHANISDSDYYSKFETEKNEMAQLLEKIFTLQQKNKKGFIIFDEPFSTTSSVLAEPLINTLIAMIQKNNGFLSFIITHLHAVLSHPETRQMSIKVIPNGDGTFTSTRKFQEGPSFDNDAAHLLAQTLNPMLRETFLKAYETEVAKIAAKKDNSLNHKHTQEPEKTTGNNDKD